MSNTIFFSIAHILVDTKLSGGLENFIIACCYFLISVLIFGDLWRNRKVAVSRLTILIASLFLIISGTYIFPKITIAIEKIFILGNWVEIVPAIAFFLIYQRYQFLLNSTPTKESNQELEQRLREATEKLQQQSHSLAEAQANLEKIQLHLAKIERLTILGQLVAGIAHEINNPINFIYGNLPYLEEYTQGLLKVVEVYQENYADNLEIEKVKEEVDLDYVRSDFPYIIASIKLGADKILELVENLRNIYGADDSQMKPANISRGIESSLLLLYNFYKNKIEIIKQLEELPLVKCYINQINQVFLTLLGKAINTLLESEPNSDNLAEKQIIVKSKKISNDRVAIQISLNAEVKERIFEPIFHPKLIGTGLGLSISHRIITEVHQGNIYCHSKSETGTTFTIELPINQSDRS
ncbi:sensor histidine kinase [Floridanema evergladense]|uniref:histidine kinase n=1 Tax=Floridaenema evergladense BLCC-F167 TaxID=3153639 RepID=A0ABV4WK93_9CYAN